MAVLRDSTASRNWRCSSASSSCWGWGAWQPQVPEEKPYSLGDQVQKSILNKTIGMFGTYVGILKKYGKVKPFLGITKAQTRDQRVAMPIWLQRQKSMSKT